MKTIIALKEREESLELLKSINEAEVKSNMDFGYISKLEITLEGNFHISFTGLSLWIEDSENEENYLKIPVSLIKGFEIEE